MGLRSIHCFVRVLRSRWFRRGVAIALGAVFIISSFYKISDPAAFAEILEAYRLFPRFSINWIAVVLPWLELLCGLALLAGVYQRAAAATVFLMLSVFIVVLVITLGRGLDVSCGCFSTSVTAENSLLPDIARDIVMLVATLFLLRYRPDL